MECAATPTRIVRSGMSCAVAAGPERPMAPARIMLARNALRSPFPSPLMLSVNYHCTIRQWRSARPNLVVISSPVNEMGAGLVQDFDSPRYVRMFSVHRFDGDFHADDRRFRSYRIELRATKEEKRLLAAAAAHERRDVTSFILRNVLPAARDIVDRFERIRLSERDTARVLEMLENPPKPTAALLAAARHRAART